ncbi:hypothetical protein [Arcanobacterium hippocoleae]|uniref:hypothetical protein n=1 Tax=Arcanobacterium hippocoleae TaxID=149017 RepID=UPI003340EA74
MRLSDIQKSVLDYLQRADDWCSIRDIAKELDVHPNSARLAVTKLTNATLIERIEMRDGAKGRPRLMFRSRTGKFNVLHDAFRSIEHATEIEKEIIESLISGKYEGCIAHEPDLVQALADFLKAHEVDVQVSGKNIIIAPEQYSEIEDEIPGFSGRVYRVLAQQAVGESAVITLSLHLCEGNFVLSVNKREQND